MNTEKNPSSPDSENSAPDSEVSGAAGEDYVPLSVRNARRIRRDLWPHLWISLASILILAAALAILSYRMGAQSCH